MPEAVIEEEKRLIAAQAANEGKPEHIIEKIVDGKLVSFFADNVLYDQEFIKSEQFDGTVGDLVRQLAVTMGENIGVVEVAATCMAMLLATFWNSSLLATKSVSDPSDTMTPMTGRPAWRCK